MKQNKIHWNNSEFWISDFVFEPKESTIGIFQEIRICLKQFNNRIPILDLCCGIGAIGISSFINNAESFNNFYGFDNDFNSIGICKKNIELHNINGKVNIWSAGEKLPILEKGIAVCNPPFLSANNSFSQLLIKNSPVYSKNDGFDVLLKCFASLKGTGHYVILKSLKNQIPKIIEEIGVSFTLIKEVSQKIESGYIVAFTTWVEKK